MRPLFPLLCICLLLGAGCTTKPAPENGAAPTGRVLSSTDGPERFADRTSYIVTLQDGMGGALTLVRVDNHFSGRTQNLFGKASGKLFGQMTDDGWQSLQWFDDLGGLPTDIRAAWTPEDVWWTTLVEPDGSHKRIELTVKPLEESVELVPVTVSRKSTPVPGASCDVRLTYPRVVSGVPQNTLEQINQSILETVTGTSTPIAPDAVERVADADLAACEDELRTLVGDLGPDASASLERFIWQDMTVELNQDGLLSLSFQTDAYYGGAHPLHHADFLTFDLRTGKTVTLQDLIQTEKLHTFFQMEKRRLLAERGELLFEDQRGEFERFTNTINSPTAEEQQKAYGDFVSFSLTPTALVTMYNEYEIAPYAAGPIRVFLPYVDIKDLLTTDSLIKRMMQP